jgi:hypothetical protein
MSLKYRTYTNPSIVNLTLSTSEPTNVLTKPDTEVVPLNTSGRTNLRNGSDTREILYEIVWK